MQGKSSCGSSAAGSVRSETSSSTIPLPLPRFLRRDSAMEKLRLRNRKSGKPAGCGSDSDDLYEGLKRAQRSRLEDQRGTEINFELPEFLKVCFKALSHDFYSYGKLVLRKKKYIRSTPIASKFGTKIHCRIF